MPISLPELRTALRPPKTSLVLGAGASVPSGAPTGAGLARILWKEVAREQAMSDDLVETASILVHRFTRKPVVAQVIKTLQKLQPVGGLLALSAFGWHQIFTTNFDRLLELAYKKAGIPLVPIRSNFDFSYREASPGVRLFKIHGCISQDETLGHKASMTLTEDDYVRFEKYRQSLFANLHQALFAGDVLVIGQSLRDQHLASLVSKALEAKHEGAPGQVYVLAYDRDDIRAPLLESKGARIAFGGLDELAHELAQAAKSLTAISAPLTESLLPLELLSDTHDVAAQSRLRPDTVRMFNGSAATYADIAAGTTFERVRCVEIGSQILDRKSLIATITGAAGVGKTTFARQLLHLLQGKGVQAWEHRTDFPFLAEPWYDVEAKLRAADRFGVLLLDECTRYLKQTNDLLGHLARLPAAHLAVVLTANSAQWTPRIKSPYVFSRGQVVELSRLHDAELNSLLNLVDQKADVAALVHADFRRLHRTERFKTLRLKASADMFVCMKNIFANESLDTILLTEFNDLDEPLQEYYRYVAALESVGMRVHRQLIIRMLHMLPDSVSAALHGLSGIVDEYEIDPEDGIYGWSTRHLVIARRISEYKFAGLEELVKLFDDIIDNINPAVQVELKSARDICDQEFGIGRLADTKQRQRLYRKLIGVVPGERIPWHRLIREMLAAEDLTQIEYVIRDAEEAVGADAPIDRYKVRQLLLRAKRTPGISESDRTAIMKKAYEQALANIPRHRADKFTYYTLCDAAIELVRRGESEYLLADAIERMAKASAEILDPDMQRKTREYQDIQASLRR